MFPIITVLSTIVCGQIWFGDALDSRADRVRARSDLIRAESEARLIDLEVQRAQIQLEIDKLELYRERGNYYRQNHFEYHQYLEDKNSLAARLERGNLYIKRLRAAQSERDKLLEEGPKYIRSPNSHFVFMGKEFKTIEEWKQSTELLAYKIEEEEKRQKEIEHMKNLRESWKEAQYYRERPWITRINK